MSLSAHQARRRRNGYGKGSQQERRVPYNEHPSFPFTRRRKEYLNYTTIRYDFGNQDHIMDLFGRN
jgi:hypothetical protein